MSRFLVLTLIAYSLLLAGIVTLHGDMLALSIPFALYLLVGYLRGPENVQLEAPRHLSAERVVPNSEVTITVTVTNRGSDLEEVLLEDIASPTLTIRDGSARHLLRLASGKSYAFTYTVSGPRGGYAFESVWAQINDHLAVTGRKVKIDARGELFVFPLITRLRHVAIRPRRTRVYAGNIPAKVGGAGAEFFGVREYQIGDPPRMINWRASARHEETLYANEYQQERVSDIGIVLDGRLRTNVFARGHSIFEYSVQAAAALADAFLTQGNRVSLLVYASFLQWTLPGYSKIQRERILHSLAHAEPGGSDVFSGLEHIPTRLFPPHSQVVLVSPLVEDDLNPLVQLRARGYQVMVISPDPVTFELSYLPRERSVDLAARVVRMERMLLLQKIQRAGVQVLDWNVTHPFDQVVQRKLSRPPAWLRAIGR